MMEKKFDKKKLVFILILMFIVILLIYYFKHKDNFITISADKINVYSANVEDGDWSKEVTIRVDLDEITVKSYSFDGGTNWQDSNEYVVTKNGKIDIVVMDIDGNKSEKIEYVVDTIDNTPPVITVNLPKEVLLNEKIDLKDYVKVTDKLSGINGDVIINPSVLDTSKVGKKKIFFSAKDNAGNSNSIYVDVEVVNKISEEKKDDESKYVTMYRYRTKKTSTYKCNDYDCSYYNDNDVVDKVEKMVETGKCDNSLNVSMTFNNGCTIIPSSSDKSCIQVVTTVDRYSSYGNYIIDIIALNTDGTQSGNSGSNKGWCDENGCTSDDINSDYSYSTYNNELTLEKQNDGYKAAPCDTNEIEIDGYCHAICSKLSYSCPNGYKMVGNVCKKYVKKTCYEDCSTVTWSEWSDWSESKIVATDDIQVETKTVKK